MVTRYRNSSAVFGWEVTNEPHCGADGVRNLPRGPNCTPALVTEWVKEISAYIKGLDPWHLIGVGDEGFFNEPGKDWAYNGTHGVDTEAFVKLETIDFGTYHIYPVRLPFSSQHPPLIWTKLARLTLGSVDQNPRLDTTMAQRPRRSTTSSR